MTRSKRHTLRRIVLGLTVAALVPATAQARPMNVTGSDARLIHQHAVPVQVSSVVGAEDLAFGRHQPGTPSVVSAESNDGYDAGTGSIAGLVLILAAVGAAVALRQGRKEHLSPA
jgi:hypothetical protein